MQQLFLKETSQNKNIYALRQCILKSLFAFNRFPCFHNACSGYVPLGAEADKIRVAIGFSDKSYGVSASEISTQNRRFELYPFVRPQNRIYQKIIIVIIVTIFILTFYLFHL